MLFILSTTTFIREMRQWHGNWDKSKTFHHNYLFHKPRLLFVAFKNNKQHYCRQQNICERCSWRWSTKSAPCVDSNRKIIYTNKFAKDSFANEPSDDWFWSKLHRQLHPFACQRFHVLLNSLFRVLFNFPSRYLFAIGLVRIFSLGWDLPPALGCSLKQPDSIRSRDTMHKTSFVMGPAPALKPQSREPTNWFQHMQRHL